MGPTLRPFRRFTSGFPSLGPWAGGRRPGPVTFFFQRMVGRWHGPRRSERPGPHPRRRWPTLSPMIVVPEDTSDAVRRRLRALEAQGCTAIVVTAIGKTGIAYYSGSLKLPDGSEVRASVSRPTGPVRPLPTRPRYVCEGLRASRRFPATRSGGASAEAASEQSPEAEPDQAPSSPSTQASSGRGPRGQDQMSPSTSSTRSSYR